MRIFTYRLFHQWMKKLKLDNSTLKKVIEEIEKGLFDAYLGCGLYKKRLSRKGQGKRSSYRTILAFKENDRCIFMYGYAKNDFANISHKEEMVFKKLAKYYLELPEDKLITLIHNNELFEVK